MAKRKTKAIEDNKDPEFIEALDNVIEQLEVSISEDPIKEKVKYFRDKGYNDNQIASMLRIHKQTIEKL